MVLEPVWLLTAAGGLIVLLALVWFVSARKTRAAIEGYDELCAEVQQAGEDLRAHEQDKARLLTVLEKSKEALAAVTERTKALVQMEARSAEIQAAFLDARKRYQNVKQLIQTQQQTQESLQQQLHDLQSDLDLYSRIEAFVDYGLFEEPDYLHDSYERFKVEIKRLRDEQAALIKAGVAMESVDDIRIDGSSKKGSAVIAGQQKLMLKAFNIECDLLMEKLNLGNYTRTLERIEKLAATLEKASASMMCGFSTEFVRLKLEEATLLYQSRLKKDEEREEQRLIKEQIREEEKAKREYERAIMEAEKQEHLYARLLGKARKELASARAEERAVLLTQVSELEEKLQQAQAREQRARSLAEQTRRGHVYVISNIGSFGEGIFKIGLTRRLDPMDRVKELGDASVPFSFDVHAIIYSDDAPALEADLHRVFGNFRVNAVNRRKEFFRVDLQQIRREVERLCGDEADFRMTVLAEEYYETLRLLGVVEEAA